jgi:hypothetical protein
MMGQSIDEFIVEWTVRSWGLVRRSRLLGACLSRVYLVPGPHMHLVKL